MVTVSGSTCPRHRGRAGCPAFRRQIMTRPGPPEGGTPNRLFADEVQCDAARVSANTVFPHINALPGAEREPPAAHGNV